MAAERGLYAITAYTQTTLTVIKLNGTAVSFTAETVTCYLLFPMLSVGGDSAISTSADWFNGIHITMADGNGNYTDLNHLTEGGKITVYDAGKSGGQYPRRPLLIIDPSAIGQENKYPFTFRRGMVVRGGNVFGGAGEESWYHRDGVRIYDAGGGIQDRTQGGVHCGHYVSYIGGQ